LRKREVHIFFLKEEDRLSENDFTCFYALLTPEFQKVISGYKHRESAQASLLGKIVLLYAFSKLYPHLSLSDIQTGNKERPYIDGNIDFNISHSGAYVIVALTQDARVGVDVEKQRKVDHNLFRKYFNDSEWMYIQKAGDATAAFFELWTIKESAIKCDGRGVEILGKTHMDFMDSETISCAGNVYAYKSIQLEAGYACSVCCNTDFEYKITETSIGELYQSLC
jgi:4'-phosphopantetheinyl transferase